ncbi:MAG TPA: hypothetical protein IGS52_16450 [Oscillatoriaceae cyanobacterium M33_DOE_052]|uniref:Uncharacterized protein n=1 Tax=Planktothricoides sp. SpSt-374 TaxID=2282167 RepID=A0A7C3VUQ1_9CYAN|nr:hypothetical protein [Oscillatoriaceae cyanobacterium M33_DOE_052]
MSGTGKSNTSQRDAQHLGESDGKGKVRVNLEPPGSKLANIQGYDPVYKLQPNMMNSNNAFLAKVIVASGAIAVAIVTGGPALNIPATSPIALTLVLLPPLLIAAILGWRAWQQH